MTPEYIEPILYAFIGALVAGFILLLFVKRGNTEKKIDELEKTVDRQSQTFRLELAEFRRDFFELLKEGREEGRGSMKQFEDSLLSRMAEFAIMQKNQLDSANSQIKALSANISSELEKVRFTVDEKLTGALEKRIGESFAQVTRQLEKVHMGLGEMQTLATGVGDLKKALTNIKTRGVWGEVALGALLEQSLAPAQFVTNVVTKPGSNERVEFAIRLPGAAFNGGDPVLLPIDAKFPLVDYQNLQEAQEAGDKEAVAKSGKALESQLKAEAKKISEKYIAPPHTTDFAVMFLPTEGLYAEALRRPGLSDSIQTQYRVTLAGPTTLTALLNSLQMGFKTLAIQERAGEVWELLISVRTEFDKFGGVLQQTRKKLQEAADTIDKMEVRSRAIGRKLKQVEELPSPDEEAAAEEE